YSLLEYIMKLNAQQQAAVEHVNGALLIIAGAGSGKTRVLTEKLAKIIEEGYAPADRILTVTFTNKAAQEIKERVLDRLTKSPKKPKSSTEVLDVNARVRELMASERFNTQENTRDIPWMGTFHSICVKILRREAAHIGYKNDFTIYDPDDQV